MLTGPSPYFDVKGVEGRDNAKFFGGVARSTSLVESPANLPKGTASMSGSRHADQSLGGWLPFDGAKQRTHQRARIVGSARSAAHSRRQPTKSRVRRGSGSAVPEWIVTSPVARLRADQPRPKSCLPVTTRYKAAEPQATAPAVPDNRYLHAFGHALRFKAVADRQFAA